jgi:chorismate synthase
MVEGLPSNLAVDIDFINAELARRQGGYGRGGRMKIETDRVRILSGVRHGRTLGSPITMLIDNRDWANWDGIMSVTPVDDETALKRRVTRPRPGHADLVGSQKYDQSDARNILERSSARETTARVAAGALAKQFLGAFGIEILSHTTAIGRASLPQDFRVTWEQLESVRDDKVVRCVLPECAERMVEEIKTAQQDGDTIGGTFEVVARHVPVGLGSHTSWDRKLDARLGAAIMSINAVKGMAVGDGVRTAAARGSDAHDEIGFDPETGRFDRLTNRAGGIEGGMSNGEDIRIAVYLKPIPTLKKALQSVDMISKEPFLAQHERSDTCVVPAAGVIGEAMVALVLAEAVLEKFGGDSIGEALRNHASYVDQLRRFGRAPTGPEAGPETKSGGKGDPDLEGRAGTPSSEVVR